MVFLYAVPWPGILRCPLCMLLPQAADNTVTSRIDNSRAQVTRRSMLLKVPKRASCMEHGKARSCRTLRCPGQRSLFVNITTTITNSLIVNTSTPTTILNINPTQLPTITHYHLLAFQRISITDHHNHKILTALCVYLASLFVQQRHSLRGWWVNNVL